MARADFHLVNETDEFRAAVSSVMRRLSRRRQHHHRRSGQRHHGHDVTSLTSLSATPPASVSIQPAGILLRIDRAPRLSVNILAPTSTASPTI